MTDPSSDQRATDTLLRFQRWLAWGVAAAVVLYLVGALWAGMGEVAGAFARFSWPIYVVVLLLTLVNYGLRFWKWHYLLGRLGVSMPLGESATIFGAGLAMVISPAKAGEFLKPYLVRVRTGFPMAHTVPALVTERVTDGLAMVGLAAVSAGTFAPGSHVYLVGTLVGAALGFVVLAHEPTSRAILRLLTRLPGLSRVGAKLDELYVATRVCVAPLPLFLTLTASVIAWGAECIGYMLVFRGFGVDASLDASTFLYAFATVAGGAMPGGLGVADGALIGGALRLVPGLTEPDAVGAALLIRAATLWFGVLLGAGALLRVPRMLERR